MARAARDVNYRMPKAHPGSPEAQAETEAQRLLTRSRQRPAGAPEHHSPEWEEGFAELEAALAAPWLHGPKAAPAAAHPREGRVTVRRAAVAPMTRHRRADGPRPEAEKPRLPLPPWPEALSVEAKAQPGLGSWRSAVVELDEGGRDVKLNMGGRSVWVPRRRIRAPEERREPRRVLAAVAGAAGAPPRPDLPRVGPPVLVSTARPKGRPLPKPRGRLHDRDYLAFVRRHVCCSCGTRRGVEAHHAGPRPVGRKTDDYRTVPLCLRCHNHLHARHELLGRPRSVKVEELLAGLLLAGELVALQEVRELLAASVREHLHRTMVEMLIEFFGVDEEPTVSLDGEAHEMPAPA